MTAARTWTRQHGTVRSRPLQQTISPLLWPISHPASFALPLPVPLQIYFYIFDFIPILLTFVFFTLWHYGLWLTPSTEVTPSPPESGAASSADLMEQGKQGQQGKQGKQVEDVEPSVRSNTSAPSATGTEATAAAQGGVQMVYVSPRQS